MIYLSFRKGLSKRYMTLILIKIAFSSMTTTLNVMTLILREKAYTLRMNWLQGLAKPMVNIYVYQFQPLCLDIV